MATEKHHNHLDFHWTPSELILSIVAGVVAVGILWLFTGLLVGLFFL